MPLSWHTRRLPRYAALRPAAPRTVGGRPHVRTRTWGRLAVHLLGRLLALIAWSSLAWATFAALPPLPAAAATTLLTAGLAWWYVLPGRAPRSRRRATLRLRGVGGAGPWLVATVPIWLAFDFAAIRVHVHWFGPPPAGSDALDALAREPAGWIPVVLFGVLFAPLLEEIFFRGFVQRTLERRTGAAAGIFAGAALFAVYHFEPWRLGHLVAGGVVLGTFVHAARSIWAGVLLHASANASLVLAQAAWGGVEAPSPGSSPIGGHLLLAGSLVLLVLLHGRVRRGARSGPAPGRPARRDPRPGVRPRRGLSAVART